MRRATTPTHIFTFPDNVDLADIRAALVSYSQCGKNILEKTLDDNDVPCFYDSVNKQTHYNRGSGDFLYELL